MGEGGKAIKIGSVTLDLVDWYARANIKHGNDGEEKYLLSFSFRSSGFNTVICMDGQ